MKKELIEKIDKAIQRVYLETEDHIIQESLKEDISDFDTYNQKKAALIKRLGFIAKAVDNKTNDDRLLAKIADAFLIGIKENIEKPISLLKEILEQKPALILYKNLESLNKEAIIEIIKDRNLVDLLEKLDKDDKDN